METSRHGMHLVISAGGWQQAIKIFGATIFQTRACAFRVFLVEPRAQATHDRRFDIVRSAEECRLLAWSPKLENNGHGRCFKVQWDSGYSSIALQRNSAFFFATGSDGNHRRFDQVDYEGAWHDVRIFSTATAVNVRNKIYIGEYRTFPRIELR